MNKNESIHYKKKQIYKITLYDSIDNEIYIKVNTEEDAINYFIKNFVLDKNDKIKYQDEYDNGISENIYIELIDIFLI